MKTNVVDQSGSLREFIARGLVSALQGIYLTLRRSRKPWLTTKEDLKLMPEGSLGKDLYHFLIENDFEMIPKAEFHDVYHVLLGYGTTIKDESLIQCAVVGNGRNTLPSFVCTSVSIIFYPEHWGEFSIAYKRGKAAKAFHNMNFEKLLLEPTKEVREQVFGK